MKKDKVAHTIRPQKDNMSETKSETKEILIAVRSEKLVAALYLVTGLLSEREPMKRSLRESSLTLLSRTNLLAHENVKDKLCLYEEALMSVSAIQTELSVARLSGTLSQMNSTLLLQGFASLGAAFAQNVKTLLLGVSEATDVLEFSSALERVERDEKGTLGVTKELGLKQAEALTTVEAALASREGVGSGGTLSPFQKNRDKTFSQTVVGYEKKMPTGVFKARKVSRREQILSLFVKGHDISIKDISSKIKGCSEKTIQRELNALVFDHIIERIGEKRWSRYVMR